jgi:transposase-like protein
MMILELVALQSKYGEAQWDDESEWDTAEALLECIPKSLMLNFMASSLLTGVINNKNNVSLDVSKFPVSSLNTKLIQAVPKLKPFIQWMDKKRMNNNYHPGLNIWYLFLDELRKLVLAPNHRLDIFANPRKYGIEFKKSDPIGFSILGLQKDKDFNSTICNESTIEISGFVIHNIQQSAIKPSISKKIEYNDERYYAAALRSNFDLENSAYSNSDTSRRCSSYYTGSPVSENNYFSNDDNYYYNYSKPPISSKNSSITCSDYNLINSELNSIRCGDNLQKKSTEELTSYMH